MFYKIKLRYIITSYNVVAVTGENKNSARGSPRAKTLQMALYDMFVSFIITFFFFKNRESLTDVPAQTNDFIINILT